jgi:hypothetical protein
MNRFSLAFALVVAIASVGCAAGVEDPEPEETVEPQRSPPQQLRTGQHADPFADVTGSVDDVRLDLRIDLRLPPKQPLPASGD